MLCDKLVADSWIVCWLRPDPNGPWAQFDNTEANNKQCCNPARRIEFLVSFHSECVFSGWIKILIPE